MIEQISLSNDNGGGSPAGGAPAGGQPAGGGAQDWRSSLPADLQSEKSLESFKDVGGLARSFVDTIKMRGAPADQFIRKPTDDATWDAALKALGRPDKADAYTWKAPENVKMEDSVVAEHRNAALKAGLLPRQFEAYLSEVAKAESARGEASAKAAKEAEEKGLNDLKNEWKDKLPAELDVAKKGYKALMPESLQVKIKAAGLENDPEFIKVMNKVGQTYKEDTNRQGGRMNFGTRDMNTVKSERLAVMGKLTAKGMDQLNPEYAILKAQSDRLFAEEAELAYAQGYGRPKDPRPEE